MSGRFAVRSVQVLPPLVDRKTWLPRKAEQLAQTTCLEDPSTTMSLRKSPRGLVSCVTEAFFQPELARSARTNRPFSVPRNIVFGPTILSAEALSPAPAPKSISAQLFPVSPE